LDVHRRQITFDYMDTDTGEVQRGRVSGTRAALRDWLARIKERPAAFAVEGCTGWRFVVEELRRAGIDAHLAEPADTEALRGPKRHAKTDGMDARHLREQLAAGTLPASWVPPEQVLEMRTRIRLYKALLDERVAWQQRIHATLFHHGAPPEPHLHSALDESRLETAEDLSPAARETIHVSVTQIERLHVEVDRLRQSFQAFARRQPGCRALTQQYGIGPISAVAIWAELGDCRRFSSSRDAVRHTGLDVTVRSSDGKRARGHLSRQGPPVLRWALYEAAQCGARATSPDRPYYASVKKRQDANRAALSVARKLVRRVHHQLRAMGDEAFAAAG